MKLTKPKQFRIRKEIILLLGADPDGGPLMRRTLEAVGYPVLSAENSEQAAELCRSFNGAIRLLIIDIALREKNALDVIATLRKRDPSLKVIVASEEISPKEQHDIYVSGVIELVRKPVDKERLLDVVHRIVGK